jgi:5-methylcytosine-specific restriction endonuclease McrA
MAADQFDLFQSRKKPTRVLTPMEKLFSVKAAHMKSAKWKKLRKAKLDQTRGQCEKCGSWMGRKDVHHKTYDRLGNERLEDLIVLCTHCHEIEDERRAAEAKQRSANALEDAIWESGLNTFATKKYNDQDWRMTYDYYDVAEEYAEWLEKKQDREWAGDDY